MHTYVVDGSNIFLSYLPNSTPSFRVLLEVLIQIKQRGDEFFCIFDANIEHKVKQKQPEALAVLQQLLLQYPRYFGKVTGGIRADDFILIYADTQTAMVISNDRFTEYLSQYNWLKNERYLIKGNVLGSLISLPHIDLVFARSSQTVTVSDLSQQLQGLMTIQHTHSAPKTSVANKTSEVLGKPSDWHFDVVDTETTPITMAEPLITLTETTLNQTNPVPTTKQIPEQKAAVIAEPQKTVIQQPTLLKKQLWLTSALVVAISLVVLFFYLGGQMTGSDRLKLSPSTAQRSVWLDPTTGVMWMRCSVGQMWTGRTCTGQASTHTWQDAQRIVAELNAGDGYAGYQDWFLPEIESLMSIVRCDRGFVGKIQIPTKTGHLKAVAARCQTGSTLPAINRSLFPNNPTAGFWSITQGANGQDAWHMAFDDGFLYPNSKQNKYHIRLSRMPTARSVKPISEPVAPPITTNTDKVWVYPKTGMMWMPCSMGQTLVNQSCQGSKKQYTWAEANDLVNALNRQGGYAGYTDWTLPHIEDLFSLSLCRSGFTKQWLIPTKSSSQKMVQTTCKTPNPNNQYWSGTTAPDQQGIAWSRGVNFGDGTTIVATQNNRFFVWLVRQP